MGTTGVILGHPVVTLFVILFHFWSYLGQFYVILESDWFTLCVMLGHPGVILGHPVVMLGHPRVILGYPRVLLGHVEVILGPPRVLWVIWKKGSLKKKLMLPRAGVRGVRRGFCHQQKTTSKRSKNLPSM